MKVDVAIIDYRMSNLHSVQAACNKVGLTSIITSDVNIILKANSAILPGVGAFGEAMSHLKKSGLDHCIYRFIESGRPFIGICLGLQLLFEDSEEFGNHPGLGLIKGSVKKFHFSEINNIKFPVPQIGWNHIYQDLASWENSLLCKNQSSDFMYFVHSYFVNPKDKNVVLSSTTYGGHQYCSGVQYENIFAVQFHPEKSGPAGIKVYEQLKKQLKGN